MDLKTALHKIADGKDLTGEEMRGAMRVIMAGEATQAQIGAFLMGMRIKGETVGEIAAAVSILREQMVQVSAPENAIDIVGTGGDGVGSLNISTATALVVAGAGVPVAKHGNKALSSRSGSSQALEALGVKLDLTPEQIGKTVPEGTTVSDRHLDGRRPGPHRLHHQAVCSGGRYPSCGGRQALARRRHTAPPAAPARGRAGSSGAAAAW